MNLKGQTASPAGCLPRNLGAVVLVGPFGMLPPRHADVVELSVLVTASVEYEVLRSCDACRYVKIGPLRAQICLEPLCPLQVSTPPSQECR